MEVSYGQIVRFPKNALAGLLDYSYLDAIEDLSNFGQVFAQ